MKQNTAPMGFSIKVLTFVFIVITISLLSGSIVKAELLWPALLLAVLLLFCYLYAPRAYEIREGKLTVYTRISRKTFNRVRSCTLPDQKSRTSGFRLWGNGGLFAATGIFWNKNFGIFRVYVTTGNHSYQLLVETSKTRILISPQNPRILMRYFNSEIT